MWSSHTVECYSALKRNGVPTLAITWMPLGNLLRNTKGHMLFESIYMKCPEWMNPDRK